METQQLPVAKTTDGRREIHRRDISRSRSVTCHFRNFLRVVAKKSTRIPETSPLTRAKAKSFHVTHLYLPFGRRSGGGGRGENNNASQNAAGCYCIEDRASLSSAFGFKAAVGPFRPVFHADRRFIRGGKNRGKRERKMVLSPRSNRDGYP